MAFFKVPLLKLLVPLLKLLFLEVPLSNVRGGDDGPSISSGEMTSPRRSRKCVSMIPLPLTVMAPRGCR